MMARQLSNESRAKPSAGTPDLRASDALFRQLVESVRDYAIFVLDREGRVTTWNAGAERIKGYSAEEIIGKHFSTFYPPEVAASGKCALELEVAAREGRFAEEGWRVRKDGSAFWAHVTISPLRRDGEVIGFAKVTRDLTERRLAEEEARRFRLLVESVKDYAIFILQSDGRVATWNLGAARIKGYQAHQIIGQHFSVFYPREDVAAGKCDFELEVATRDGRFEEEGWRVRRDGSRFWANVTITALRDTHGALIGFAKVTRDLTARREAEELQRELAANAAALAEKARTQEFQERFLAILGHDLRNPLASIDMGTGLLQQQASDPVAERILLRMVSSSQRMMRMINQILDLTRARLSGGLEVYRRKLDLRETIVAVVDELRAAHPSRTIELRSPSLLGAWDSDRLKQVFSNLVGNAVAYGAPLEPVTIDVSLEGDSVRIDVHNAGEPVPEPLQASLFDPFRRGERESRTLKTAGLGLGLHISREIVSAHGGTLDFESSAEHGTTFRVILPKLYPGPEKADQHDAYSSGG